MKKFILLSAIALISCSTFKNISKISQFNRSEKIAVLPFVNNAETPMSGLKVKNMIENELYYKNLNVAAFESSKNGDSFSEKDISDSIQAMNDKVGYIFYGYVNEWRYKAGIDAEPAVSITINLYDTKNHKVIWSASGSKNMSSYKSTSLAAQKLIKRLMTHIK